MHPSPQHLEGLVLGTLVADEAQEVADHVERCDECEATVRSLEAGSDTYINALRERVPPQPFVDEVDCARLVSLIEQIGHGSIFAAGQSFSAGGAKDQDTDLGQLGQYRLLEKLGSGGMGTVYKAFHVKLKRVVALKVLPPDRLQDAGAVARFEREMEAAGKVHHENIVAATDAGEHNGTHFLVMEYIIGRDLSQLVKDLGPLPVADACEIIRQAALGLACAHEHGLVHRDIKPSNLMLAVSGQRSAIIQKETDGDSIREADSRKLTAERCSVKILDLGLALLASPHSPQELTSTGQVMGTLDYMAPEQVSDAHRVGAAADIYSLGATLYKLLTGVPVYHGSRYTTLPQKLHALMSEAAPPIAARRPDLHPALNSLVGAMLARQPAERPPSASEVARLLAPLTHGHQLGALLSRAATGERFASEGSSAPSHFDETDDGAAVSAARAGQRSAPQDGLEILGPAATPVLWPHGPVSREPDGFAAVNLEPKPRPASNRRVWLIGALVAALAGIAATICVVASLLGMLSRFFADEASSYTLQSAPIGQVLYIDARGSTSGFVWGSDIYTCDSSLSAAAVHAGVLRNGEQGRLKVTIMPGQSSYTGTSRNGVNSSFWQSYPRSFRVERAPSVKPAAQDGVLPAPTDLREYSDKIGQTLQFDVIGATYGSVWGTDVYTADSPLQVAAVHAGAVREGQRATVKVTILPGQESYPGSTRNGVTTGSWGLYPFSYRVERFKP